MSLMIGNQMFVAKTTEVGDGRAVLAARLGAGLDYCFGVLLSSLNVCAVFNLGDDATDTALEAHAELRERLAIVPHHRPGELPTRLSEAVAAKVDSISH